MNMLKKALLGAFMMGGLLSAGCSLINAAIPPSTDITFYAAGDVNPDLSGRPSPVVVKVFELSSRTIFDTQDFFTLYESPEHVLGPDLLKKDELELQPDGSLEYKMKLDKTARYVGVVVAYRDIDSARWRAVVEVKPTEYGDVVMNIEKLAVYASKK
ncbi:type VI secretion system lipoprotein TssJ [Thalassomonas viridans]|uniref:Type VI secretion system lipoprotein TssJ n=1 Tax=Thalassomonas viridans TaxID=137584 RepID=A0AAE9YY00_9GAMM|nr:type VI secretion system lipoprotein TssJ [Thalassomonas viridans]WDE03296.1 type VI secretion system lipoprotein TssJ [Thalassomonas viridans]